MSQCCGQGMILKGKWRISGVTAKCAGCVQLRGPKIAGRGSVEAALKGTVQAQVAKKRFQVENEELEAPAARSDEKSEVKQQSRIDGDA